MLIKATEREERQESVYHTLLLYECMTFWQFNYKNARYFANGIHCFLNATQLSYAGVHWDLRQKCVTGCGVRDGW